MSKKIKLVKCKKKNDCFLDEQENAIANTSEAALQLFRRINCDKCVWQYNSCSGPVHKANKIEFTCPTGLVYKRDPPDGGYYG